MASLIEINELLNVDNLSIKEESKPFLKICRMNGMNTITFFTKIGNIPLNLEVSNEHLIIETFENGGNEFEIKFVNHDLEFNEGFKLIGMTDRNVRDFLNNLYVIMDAMIISHRPTHKVIDLHRLDEWLSKHDSIDKITNEPSSYLLKHVLEMYERDYKEWKRLQDFSSKLI